MKNITGVDIKTLDDGKYYVANPVNGPFATTSFVDVKSMNGRKSIDVVPVGGNTKRIANLREDTGWSDWDSIVLNSDLVFGTLSSFSIPANSNIRKTVDLPGMGSGYRLFGYAKGSDWATVTAVYCNNNQAVLDVRNFASSTVNVSVDYTIIRK